MAATCVHLFWQWNRPAPLPRLLDRSPLQALDHPASPGRSIRQSKHRQPLRCRQPLRSPTRRHRVARAQAAPWIIQNALSLFHPDEPRAHRIEMDIIQQRLVIEGRSPLHGHRLVTVSKYSAPGPVPPTLAVLPRGNPTASSHYHARRLHFQTSAASVRRYKSASHNSLLLCANFTQTILSWETAKKSLSQLIGRKSATFFASLPWRETAHASWPAKSG